MIFSKLPNFQELNKINLLNLFAIIGDVRYLKIVSLKIMFSEVRTGRKNHSILNQRLLSPKPASVVPFNPKLVAVSQSHPP